MMTLNHWATPTGLSLLLSMSWYCCGSGKLMVSKTGMTWTIAEPIFSISHVIMPILSYKRR